ncbi:hypothetical protein WAI453_011101 [Rhynchosporium graminicola]
MFRQKPKRPLLTLTSIKNNLHTVVLPPIDFATPNSNIHFGYLHQLPALPTSEYEYSPSDLHDEYEDLLRRSNSADALFLLLNSPPEFKLHLSATNVHDICYNHDSHPMADNSRNAAPEPEHQSRLQTPHNHKLQQQGMTSKSSEKRKTSQDYDEDSIDDLKGKKP